MTTLNNFIVVSDDDNQLLAHLKSNCTPSKSTSNQQKLEFTLDTKYYSSSISLSNFDSLRTLAIWRVSNKETPVQSICYFMKRSQSVLDLTKIDSLSEYFSFDTKIIACFLSAVPQPFATTLSQWATDRGYEIVDLEPSDDDVTYFKEINERYGFDRIIEILEGTSWNKKDTKSQAGMAAATAARLRLKEEDGESSDEFEEFDGNLDAKDKQLLESLMASESILDYYIKQGLDGYPAAEGELSKIEEQERSEKKAKINAKKNAKAKAAKAKSKADGGANDLSDDVGIEIDRDDTAIPKAPIKSNEEISKEKPGSSKSIESAEVKIEKIAKVPKPDSKSLEDCLKTMLNVHGEADDNMGMEIIGQLNDLRNEFASKSRDDRLEMAARVASGVFKLFPDDKDEEKKADKLK